MIIRHLQSAGEIAGALISGGTVYAIDLKSLEAMEVRSELVNLVLDWYHACAIFIEVYEEESK